MSSFKNERKRTEKVEVRKFRGEFGQRACSPAASHDGEVPDGLQGSIWVVALVFFEFSDVPFDNLGHSFPELGFRAGRFTWRYQLQKQLDRIPNRWPRVAGQFNDRFRQVQHTSTDVVIGVSIKSLAPEGNGKVVSGVSDIIDICCRSLTGQGVRMRDGNPCDGIELLGIRLCVIEFTNKHVALVACFRTDVVEERIADQPPKSPEGRPTHNCGITLPKHS